MTFKERIASKLNKKLIKSLKERSGTNSRLWLNENIYDHYIEFDNTLSNNYFEFIKIIRPIYIDILLDYNKKEIFSFIESISSEIEDKMIFIMNNLDKSSRISYIEKEPIFNIGYRVIYIYFNYSILEW